MAYYRIVVRDQNLQEIGEFPIFRNLKFGKRLNNYGACEFQIPAKSVTETQLISLRKYSVWVYYILDGQQILKWAGEQAVDHAEFEANDNDWITLYSFTWMEQLKDRYTAQSVRYDQIDAGEIGWQLINGAFGITKGDIEPTQPRDRQYYTDQVLEKLIQLTNVQNGFDCEVTDFKVFNASAHIGVDRSEEIVLEYGRSFTRCKIDRNFSTPVNRGIVLGESIINPDSAETTLSRVDVDNAELQAEFQLRESVYSDVDISEENTLQEKAEALIEKFGLPIIQIDAELAKKISTIHTRFALGDLVRIVISHGNYQIDSKFRVYEWEITYNTDNTEDLRLVLGNFRNT